MAVNASKLHFFWQEWRSIRLRRKSGKQLSTSSAVTAHASHQLDGSNGSYGMISNASSHVSSSAGPSRARSWQGTQQKSMRPGVGTSSLPIVLAD